MGKGLHFLLGDDFAVEDFVVWHYELRLQCKEVNMKSINEKDLGEKGSQAVRGEEKAIDRWTVSL